jgi:hypothetical protein
MGTKNNPGLLGIVGVLGFAYVAYMARHFSDSQSSRGSKQIDSPENPAVRTALERQYPKPIGKGLAGGWHISWSGRNFAVVNHDDKGMAIGMPLYFDGAGNRIGKVD